MASEEEIQRYCREDNSRECQLIDAFSDGRISSDELELALRETYHNTAEWLGDHDPSPKVFVMGADGVYYGVPDSD